MNFKTAPFAHQLAEFNASALERRRALFWEQGTGKTWYGINSTAAAYRREAIRGVVVVAPSGVERNWVTDEIPAHWPDDIPYLAHVWSTGRSGTQKHQREVAFLLSERRALPILAMTYDALMTTEGRDAVWAMMRTRPVYLHVDESAHAKNFKAKRTERLVRAAPYAAMTRIYSGTPVDNSPFDVYSQVLIVDPHFWEREFDLPDWFAFQHFFGVFAKGSRRIDETRTREFPQLVAYQNIALLRDALKKISGRVLKDDVLDLPEKLYTRRYYEMFPRQRAMYDALENEYMADFPDDPDAMVTAELPIVRMLRLQQILCGYVPKDGEEEPTQLIDPKHNPRLDCTEEFVCEAGNNQTMVACQYRLDVELIVERLVAAGRHPVTYTGSMSPAQRARAKEAFQKGDVSDFVAMQAMGAEGLTFTNAHTMAFHSNAYRMGKRKQFEDRVHRIGQRNACLYGDMVCAGTRDAEAIRILQRKHRMSESVLGDVPKEWL